MRNLIFCFFIILFSCQEKAPTSPEGVLQTYVNKRFKGASINELASFMSPSFKEKLSDLADTKYDELKKFKKKQFKFISKGLNCSKNVKCNITYYISYIQDEGNKNTFNTETKKIATLIKEGESWVIDEIDHIKTFHDMKQGIDIQAK